jgi:hypothetical protein
MAFSAIPVCFYCPGITMRDGFLSLHFFGLGVHSMSSKYCSLIDWGNIAYLSVSIKMDLFPLAL